MVVTHLSNPLVKKAKPTESTSTTLLNFIGSKGTPLARRAFSGRGRLSMGKGNSVACVERKKKASEASYQEEKFSRTFGKST